MAQLEHRLPADGSSAIAMGLFDALVGDVTARVLEHLRQRPEPRFLSKRALAEHLGVSERRIKTLRARGLPARKIGRDLYFDLKEVNRFIDAEGRL